MPIRRLPERVINRIAAGEVVERPASAVKELVENSLDAGAGRVEITLRDGGRSLIAVVDDGSGMSPEELALAVERHATSKLPDDDLRRIATLGFRGEALPSIGAVARMTMTSRPRQAENAWALAVEAGVTGELRPAGHPPGTRVEVRELFFATPARLKFLKAPATEFSHAVEAIERLAMAHPRVAFLLTDGGRKVLDLPARPGTPADARLARLADIMGAEFSANAVALGAERDGSRVTGFAGLPTLHRRTSAMQYLFVNGRPVRDRLLYGAVRAAYHDLLPHDRHPLLALFLDVPAEDVDVNVHPMKTEVRFRESALIRSLIVGALKHALEQAGHRATSSVATAALAAFRPEGRATGGQSSFAYPSAGRTPASGLADVAARFQRPFDPRPAGTATMLADGLPSVEIPPLGHARAQVHETFIVSQTADGIVIVDQHAAHERLVHERLQRALAGSGIERQALLIPEVVEMDARIVDRLLQHQAELAGLGMIVESFGPSAVVVREIPALLGAVDVRGLIRDLAEDLAELGDAGALRDRLSEICATIACHGSVRAGRRLSVAEMDALLRAMEETPHAGQCSHGRPTYVELKLVDIERLFGRR